MAHASNSNTRESKAGGSPEVEHQPELHSEAQTTTQDLISA